MRFKYLLIFTIFILLNTLIFADYTEVSFQKNEYHQDSALLNKYFNTIDTYKNKGSLLNVIPGGAFILVAKTNKNIPLPENYTLTLGNQENVVFVKVPFVKYRSNEYYALIPIPAHLKSGIYTVSSIENNENININDKIPQKISFSVNIIDRNFYKEKIALAYSEAKARKKPPSKKVIQEADEIWDLTNQRDINNVFTIGGFNFPIENYKYITGMFADQRIFTYPNGKTVQGAMHGGVDIAAPSGTLVYAPAKGRVVMAKKRIVTGNSVVIEHFPGVYTMYYHLRSINVTKDELVFPGTILGQVGTTGISTGPHLHWEMRINNVRVDPILFFQELDKVYSIDILY